MNKQLMPDIAFFDFDGTITSDDTFSPFIFLAIPPKRLKRGKLTLAPLIIGYKLGLVSGRKLRTAIVSLGFKGCPADQIQQLGRQFSQDFIPNVIRPQAMQQIQWHLNRGDRVVVVSASMDVYLKPWCDLHNLDLICSEIEVKDRLMTGRYLNLDCSGKRKKQRILDRYSLADFNEIYTYGDTTEDRDMLSLGTHQYYQWQKIK